MLAVILAAIACSRDSAEKDAAPAAETVVHSLQKEKVPGPVLEGTTFPELPASGEVVIRPSGETVTVLANQAPVTGLLRQLAQTFGFELVLLGFQDRPVEVLAVGATLGDVLAQALDGIPYALRYGVRNGRSRLAWLAVGEGVENANAELTRDEDRRKAERNADEREKDGSQWEKEREEETKEKRTERRRPLSVENAERRARFLAERPEREAVRRTETLESLGSRDPETRREATRMLDPDTPVDADHLADLVAYDDDFRVRVAAVEQLELSGTRASVEAITGALWDPQPEVVVAAIKALRLLGDSSTVPLVQPLLEHENDEVRGQTKELIEILEQSQPAE